MKYERIKATHRHNFWKVYFQGKTIKEKKLFKY